MNVAAVSFKMILVVVVLEVNTPISLGKRLSVNAIQIPVLIKKAIKPFGVYLQ